MECRGDRGGVGFNGRRVKYWHWGSSPEVIGLHTSLYSRGPRGTFEVRNGVGHETVNRELQIRQVEIQVLEAPLAALFTCASSDLGMVRNLALRVALEGGASGWGDRHPAADHGGRRGRRPRGAGGGGRPASREQRGGMAADRGGASGAPGGAGIGTRRPAWAAWRASPIRPSDGSPWAICFPLTSVRAATSCCLCFDALQGPTICGLAARGRRPGRPKMGATLADDETG